MIPCISFLQDVILREFMTNINLQTEESTSGIDLCEVMTTLEIIIGVGFQDACEKFLSYC